jgi:oligopeptide/dipeptide ABC transporter ATP-binding protein
MSVLDPVYTVGDQIAEAINTHMDLTKTKTWEHVFYLLRQVNIPSSRAKSYPHELSGGMRQRVMIAMALACNPKLVIADEPTTALDVVTQAQIIKLIKNIQKNYNLSIIYISHELSVLGQACNRIAIMYAGKIVEIGNVEDIFKNPQHPYTQGLLGSCMDFKSLRKRVAGIPGRPPDLVGFFQGCRFHPRCRRKQQICENEEPELRECSQGLEVACHFPGESRGTIE